MNLSFLKRDFTQPVVRLELDYEVERYSHAAYGGPKEARINVRGGDSELWQLLNRVRYPTTIYTDKGDPSWWGYISNIEANVLYPGQPERGRVHVGVSIDELYNSVAVAYAKVDLTDGTKSRDTTSYFVDDVSVAEYGTKQLLWSPGAATETHANNAGTAKLYQQRYPEPVITPADDEEESSAVITCRGWWDTLEWQYYTNSGTASVDTATQAGTIIVAKGQFFNTLFQDDTSGISLRETTDGDNTAMYYTLQLLQTGTTNNRRLLAEVDPWRNVRIYEEPQRTSQPYRLLSDGSFQNQFGEAIRNELCPVAFWAQRVDVISTSADAYLLSDPSWVFVEEMEYIVEENKLIHRARGDPDPWEFPVVEYG